MVAVRFEWDPGKSDRNLLDRGFDFEFATGIFEAGTLERVDDRRDYGERRIVGIGVVSGVHLAVVYTNRADPSGPVRRIISARLSNRHERDAYAKAVEKKG